MKGDDILVWTVLAVTGYFLWKEVKAKDAQAAQAAQPTQTNAIQPPMLPVDWEYDI